MTVILSRRAVVAGAAALPCIAADVSAQAQPCTEDARARQLREDFPWLARYAADNAAVTASSAAVDIIFMGDSMTEGWRERHPAFFGKGRVCRGIGGQTTPQMVLRMMADVVALRPRAVHIMAGTNDVAGNTGPMTPGMSHDNLAAMAALARGAGIAVLLASVPPADGFPWRPGLETVAPIRALNRWIEAHARATGATWIDYHPVLAAPDGAMRAEYTDDGVHPNQAGYAAMESVLTPILTAMQQS